MAIVGAYARIDPDAVGEVRDRLRALPGVTSFDLDEPAKVGLVIESTNMDGAHRLLTRTVRGTEGVWGVWPVYAQHEDDDEVEAATAKRT